MFRVTAANPNQKRTLRPVYANHQATPYAGFLDPEWARTFDILPGTVVTRKPGTEVFAPCTDPATKKPFGLSALFVAPTLGIDEVTGTGSNNFTAWVGDEQAVFEVLSPAFDVAADWDATVEARLTCTAQGKLTPVGSTGAASATVVIAELVEVISTDKILIRLNHAHSV